MEALQVSSSEEQHLELWADHANGWPFFFLIVIVNALITLVQMINTFNHLTRVESTLQAFSLADVKFYGIFTSQAV